MNPFYPNTVPPTSISREEWLDQVGDDVRKFFETSRGPEEPPPLQSREETQHFFHLIDTPFPWTTSEHPLPEVAENRIAKATIAALSEQVVESISSWIESPESLLTFVAPTDIFRTSAMLRSARILADGISRKSATKGVSKFRIRATITGLGDRSTLHADSAPHALIRSTIQAVGAVLGLADELSFLNLPQGSSSLEPFSDSCNAKHRFHSLSEILREEAQLGTLKDVLAGSYFVENITWRIVERAEKALSLRFGEIIDHKLPINRSKSGLPSSSEGWPGAPPFIRGPYPTMYCGKPWTVRQYAGFSGAEETNAFFKNALSDGQKGLSVAFDLPTHRGYDSDHFQAEADVGKAGVSVDTVEDMKRLFDGIPLNSVSVSMTMNGAVLPIMAFFIVAAEEAGISADQLSGTIQNDILKEYMVRNTYIYPPEPSMYIVSSVMSWLSRYSPKFNSISVSGYHMHEAGATASQEIAYTLANGLAYIEAAEKAGIDLERIAARMSFFWAQGMDFLTETAKLRAARGLWCRLLREKGIQSAKSLALRCHSQTSGWSLTRQDPVNNVIRTTLEAVSAINGGTQSLHTNSLDEAVALPSDSAARIARHTQIILAEESGICEVIDPWGGSFHLESLTETIAEEALKLIEEVNQSGGMVAAISKGIPQRKIESSAAARQAQIDGGKEKIVGVNHLETSASLSPEPRIIDGERLLERQSSTLQEIRKKRDNAAVAEALFELRESAQSRRSDLLDKAIFAARKRATLGEISAELEIVFGRHEANHTIATGIYIEDMNAPANEEEIQILQKRVRNFSSTSGRRPRILVAKLGQDGHDRGAKVVAGAFSDFGFDVDIAPLFQTPDQVFRQAVDNDVHIVGISSLAGAHMTLVGRLLEMFKEAGLEQIRIVVGGIIPDCDREKLLAAGVSSIFGPGSRLPQCANDILDALEQPESNERS